jgi:hypothetical protein
MRLALSVAFVTVLAGCAYHGGPVPAPQPSTAWLLPDGSDVLVQVVGLSQIAPTGVYPRTGYRAVQMRMTVTNTSDVPWIVDPRKQIARMGGFGISFPSDVSSHPLVVPPRETRAIDLYYPIPRPQFGPEIPMHVWLDWIITRPDGIVMSRARAQFDRDRKYGWIAQTRM